MKTKTVALIAICAVTSGCKSIHNEFRSSSVVGYVAPDLSAPNPTLTGDQEDDRHARRIQHLNYLLQNELTEQEREAAQAHQIAPDTCIAIDIMGSYFGQSFETIPETLYASIFSRTPLSELALSAKVSERLSSTVSIADGSSSTNGSEHTLMTWTGQEVGRPLPFQGLPIYGPRVYRGGDLIISLRLSELDKNEMQQLSERFSGIVEKASSTLPQNEREAGAAQLISNAVLVDSFKWTGTGITLVGLKAAEAAAETFKYLHEDDDSIIDLTFFLSGQTPTSSPLTLPSLREGYYPVIRASTREDFPQGLSEMKIDTRYPRMYKTDKRIWMVLRVRRAGGCATPS